MMAGTVPGHHAPRPMGRAEAFRSQMLTRRAHECVTTTHRNWVTGSGDGLRTSLGAHRWHQTGNTAKSRDNLEGAPQAVSDRRLHHQPRGYVRSDDSQRDHCDVVCGAVG
jgi:hypothetical protein